jgi:toxin-antitoxin system PIN domain toxin
MIYLLDVNVVIAMIDPGHIAHDDAHRWLESLDGSSWALSPVIENGVIRIVGNPRYPNSPGSPAAVVMIVRALRGASRCQFWDDDISLIGTDGIDASKILTSAQVTDTYLLALAKAHDGKLATFDRKLSTAAVKDGKSHLYQIPSG